MTLPHFWLMGSKERQTILSRNARTGSHYSQVLVGHMKHIGDEIKILVLKVSRRLPSTILQVLARMDKTMF